MLIHYHGLPITPAVAALPVIQAGHAFVSYRAQEQLAMVLDCGSSFALDNGAFSAWTAGEPVKDWSGYYEWVAQVCKYPAFDFAVIPDVIDGDEAANDALLDEWPMTNCVGAPVWHLHESFGRLERLIEDNWRVCLGSSGAFAQIGTPEWWTRMADAMDCLCYPDGTPRVKIHGLRMLDPKVFTRFPFASADSTNIARNIGIDQKWRGTYTPPNKTARAALMRARIESFQSPQTWVRGAQQETFFDLITADGAQT